MRGKQKDISWLSFIAFIALMYIAILTVKYIAEAIYKPAFEYSQRVQKTK